jgi:hypothetical protein
LKYWLSRGYFLIRIFLPKGSPDGSWNPEEKGDEDSQTDRFQDRIDQRSFVLPKKEFYRHDLGIRILYSKDGDTDNDQQDDPQKDLHGFLLLVILVGVGKVGIKDVR